MRCLRSIKAGLLALAAAAVMAAPAAAASGPKQVLFSDNFKSGFDLTHSWAYLALGPFVANGGVATPQPNGLDVKADGTNPTTGEPAFTELPFGEGDFNHVKWMADTQHLASTGFPGFDATPGQVLACSMQAKGQTFGTQFQPFGSAVTNPQSDLRLASYAMNVIDYETGMVFDTWETNTKIYPYYERLNLTGTATYQAFSSIFPGVSRSKNSEDTVELQYDRSAGIVRWVINGHVAAQVDKIGFPAPGATMLINRGGTPELAAPRQLNCGMALFTLMDGGLPPSNQGLVNLGGAYDFPSSFAGGPDEFGQGAEMLVHKFEVDSTPASH